MKILTITINMENDAFAENERYEIKKILTKISSVYQNDGMERLCYDSNGNQCGMFECHDED